MKRIFILGVILAQSALADPTYTTLSDTVFTPFSGVKFTGKIDVSSPVVAYYTDGTPIARWTRTISISAGVISLQLVPNDAMTPDGTYYTFVFRPDSGTGWTQYCKLPSSPSTVGMSTVVSGDTVCTYAVPPAVVIAGPAGPAGPISRIANAGTLLPLEGILNFNGGCADNSGSSRTDCIHFVLDNANATMTGVYNVSGGKFRLPEKTVATLPAASSFTNHIYVATDGASASDCTSGGASTRALCISNGTAWVALGGGSGGGGTGDAAGYASPGSTTFSVTKNTGQTFEKTLTGNLTFTTDTTGITSSGRPMVTFRFIQDGTGGHSVTWPSNVHDHGDVNTTAGAVSVQTFVWDGTNFQVVSAMVTPGGLTACFPGSSSGSTCVQAGAAASGLVTLPSATDVLIGKATTDTLTHKTFDTAGAGNSLKINGTSITDVSGTGDVCLSSGSACSGGSSSFVPPDVTTFYRHINLMERSNAGGDVGFTTTSCSGGGSVVGASGMVLDTDPGSGIGSMAQSALCFVYYPGRAGSDTPGTKLKDFTSGSTPKTWTVTGYYRKVDTNNDHYVGISQAVGSTDNFVGLYYNKANDVWRCVVKSGGSTLTTNNITFTPDTTAHSFSISNDGTANSVTCAIGGSSTVTSAGTFPVGNEWVIAGSPGGGSSSSFEWIEMNLYITGRAN